MNFVDDFLNLYKCNDLGKKIVVSPSFPCKLGSYDFVFILIRFS